jgi:hypothetical protein
MKQFSETRPVLASAGNAQLLWNSCTFQQNARTRFAKALWDGITFESALENFLSEARQHAPHFFVSTPKLQKVWRELQAEFNGEILLLEDGGDE